MKVLILSQFYAPEPAFKMPDLARELVRRGHHVEVLTGFPCYPFGQIYDGYRQSLGLAETIDGVRIHRVPQFPDHSRSAWRRALYYLSFALSAATLGLFRVQRADVLLVYQSAMPTGLAGAWIAFWRRMPMALDVVDLWPESVSESGILRSPRAIWMIDRAIRFVYRRAQRINVITEGYRRNLLTKSVAPEKLALIHCWPARDRFDPVEPDPQLAERLEIRGGLLITYAGAIGPIQDLRVVLDAAEELQSQGRRVAFAIAGAGVEESELIEEARRRQLKNVSFLGRLAPEVVQQLYALSDALLVHLKPSRLTELSIPSKTFAYMASGRPLLMAVAGEASELVRRHRCGLAVTPGDPAALANAVRSFESLSETKRGAMGRAARSAYLEHYSSPVQTAKFESLLLDTLGSPKSPPARRAAA